jgi:hypothetical protein
MGRSDIQATVLDAQFVPDHLAEAVNRISLEWDPRSAGSAALSAVREREEALAG